jgi:hypothetical protein
MNAPLIKYANAAPSDDVQRAFDEVIGLWNGAASTWSPESFAAIYTPDAVFFGGRQAP